MLSNYLKNTINEVVIISLKGTKKDVRNHLKIGK